jgi:hypothetical protein
MTPKIMLQKINSFRQDFRQMAIKAAESAALAVGADVQRGSLRYKFTGRHSAGWDVTSHPQGAILRNDVPYAIVLETGRRAGAKRPPIKALIPWVAKKFGIRSRLKQWWVAKRVADGIKRKGSPAKGTVFKNIHMLERQAQNVFARELGTRVKSALP